MAVRRDGDPGRVSHRRGEDIGVEAWPRPRVERIEEGVDVLAAHDHAVCVGLHQT